MQSVFGILDAAEGKQLQRRSVETAGKHLHELAYGAIQLTYAFKITFSLEIWFRSL
jgi:hypothetical protein